MKTKPTKKSKPSKKTVTKKKPVKRAAPKKSSMKRRSTLTEFPPKATPKGPTEKPEDFLPENDYSMPEGEEPEVEPEVDDVDDDEEGGRA